MDSFNNFTNPSASFQELNASGQLPWMPTMTTPAERNGWMNGWKYENTFFVDSEQKPMVHSANDLPEDIQYQRRATLGQLIDWDNKRTEEFEKQAAVVDRVLAETKPKDWEAKLDKINDEYSKGRNIELKSFEGHTVNTPMSWFQRFKNGIPEDVMPSQFPVDDLFHMTAMDGRLANHRPSEVAAAMVTHLIGEDKATPYLCGYDLSDYSSTLSELQNIINP